jgi:hypothetical protein
MARYSDDWVSRYLADEPDDVKAHLAERYNLAKRRKPLYNTATRGSRQLAVIGHYETECGGCDTIKTPDCLFYLIELAAVQGYDVLWEGLLMSMDFKRTVPLSKRHRTLIIGMDVPLDVCLDSINQRRWSKNPDKPAVPVDNTTRKWHGTRQTIRRLADAGLETVWLDRDGTVERALKELS